MDTNIENVRLFLPELRLMIRRLEQDKRLIVHTRIDQFHYMTRAEELNILLQQYESDNAKLENTSMLIFARYDEILNQYKMDSAWIAELK